MSQRTSARPTPIAIVGIGCVLPDARDASAFWQNNLDGRCSIHELGGSVWDWERYFDTREDVPDRTYCRLGAQIRDYAFDWRRFRVPPVEVEQINPMQLMVLEAGVAAVDAVKVIPHETTGLFIGATGLGWQRHSGLRVHMGRFLSTLDSVGSSELTPAQRKALLEATKQVLDGLGPVTEDTVVNTAASVALGRIAMHHDLRGLHYAIDAGFASSLAALDVAVRALRDHTIDMAVVGGASELIAPLEQVAFAKLGGLARERLAAFDARAEGTLLGEGTVMFALKRLDEAIRDGEAIRAVLLGVGGSSDGRGKALVAPHSKGQVLAMRRAWEDAGVSPQSLAYVECHATGTQVGDRSELEALRALLSTGVAPRSIALGSGKAFVGHLRGAAGALGLLRAILVLEHRVVPGQINLRELNPQLAESDCPFVVPTRTMPLVGPRGDHALRAAVSAFGFGGNNFHAVLEAWDPRVRYPASQPPVEPEPIAIVGMGGRFPGAKSVPEFADALARGYDATREIPPERWSLADHYDPDPNRRETTYSKLGCFVDLPDALDVEQIRRLRILPAARDRIDPSHVLILQAADEALRDAGYAEQPSAWDHDRVATMLAFLPYQGVKFSADLRVSFPEYAAAVEQAASQLPTNHRPSAEQLGALLDEVARRFVGSIPTISEDTMTGYLGSINGARIQNAFDFHGHHFVVDSACASTHAAVHASVMALRHRTCDVALTGGVWADMRPEFYVAACRFNALSATGITPFDAAANGFVPGEGGGVFVLRRLSDALRDGQRIHALLRSVGGSSDGRGRSVLAPSSLGEATAMRRALAQVGADPASVEYVECHGTGTALGDVVELEACAVAYSQPDARKARGQPLWVGSVKSNIGHLNSAAGVPSLVKATLAVRDGKIAPSIKAVKLNPAVDFAGSQIEVVTKPIVWSGAKGPRRAGVSGFGVGGSNMHMLVEEYRPQVVAVRPDPIAAARSQPVVARPRVAAHARRDELDLAIACGDDLRECVAGLHALARARDLPDALARSQHEAKRSAKERLRVAVVAPTLELLRERTELLERMLEHRRDPSVLMTRGVFVARPSEAGEVAVSFPGQGPQYPNMLREAAERFAPLDACLAEADAAYQRLSGRPLRPAFWTEGPEQYEQPDEDIHCAVLAVNVALYRLLERYGLSADAVVGQSAGELSALVAAGVLDLADALAAVRERTLSVLALQLADPGRMITLGCSADQARPLLLGLPGYAVIAADNGPEACIVSATSVAADALVDEATRRGVDARALPVSHGYHSDLIAGARPRYRAALDQLRFATPRRRIASTITGGAIEGLDPRELPTMLERQLIEPVRLQDAMLLLHRQGVRLFVECGPKWGLTSFTHAILGERPHVAQATIHPKVGEVEQLHRALACLFVHGALDGVERDEARQLERDQAPGLDRLLGTLAREPERGSAAARTSDSLASAENSLAMLRAIGQVVDAFVRQVELGRTSSAASPEAGPSAERVVPSPAEVPAPTSPPAPPESALPTPALPAPARPKPTASAHSVVVGFPSNPPSNPAVVSAPVMSAAREENTLYREVEQLLRERLVARTGYPPEMLEPDLDLEADLGIDTVKQVAIFAEAREHWRLDQEQGMRLRDFNTLRKVATHFVRRLLERERTPAPPPPAPAPEWPSVERRASPQRSNRFAEVEAVVRAKLVERTGYPEEMLDPDLDLEADLGIDTVKQLAIFAETREQFGVPQDPSLKLRDFSSIRKVAAYLSARLEAGLVGPSGPKGVFEPAAPSAAMAAASAPTLLELDETPKPFEESRFEQVRVELVRRLVERTGYPEEMLELDLDLEADLGIDTVKQVAIFAETREHFELARDPSLKLRDFNTIRKVARHLSEALARERPRAAEPHASVSASPPAKREGSRHPPAVDVNQRSEADDPRFAELCTDLIRRTAERTGYPAEMLELDLDLEADLGIDTVKQVAIFAEVREQFGITRDPLLKLREFNTLRKVAAYLLRRLGSRPITPTVPAAVVSLASRREASTARARPTSPTEGEPEPEPATLLRESSRVPAVEYVEVPEFELEPDEPGVPSIRDFSWSSPIHTVSHQRQLLDTITLACMFEGLLRFEPPKRPTELEGLEFALGSRPPAGERLEVEIRGPNFRHYAVRVHAQTRLQVHAEACLELVGQRILQPVREVRMAVSREMGREHPDPPPMTKTAGGSTIEWVETLRFDTIVGCMRTVGDEAEATRYTHVIDGAFAFASIAWYRLTGGLYKLASIDRVKFHLLPQPEDPLYFHVRLASRLGGRWRADAIVLDRELRMVGELVGVSGHQALVGDVDDRAPSPADSGTFGWNVIDIG